MDQVMGIEVLEEKYQRYRSQNPDNIKKFDEIAKRVAFVQEEMRVLFDDLTPLLCKDCKAPCCQCMPVEGFFTENDYFIYRSFYDAPFDLKVDHGIETGCAFLGEKGCVLPVDIRPFPCVKVNCKALRDELDKKDRLVKFKGLYDDLEKIQKEIWALIN